MGNANSINKHIENAQKTGVCQVANMDIKEVGGLFTVFFFSFVSPFEL